MIHALLLSLCVCQPMPERGALMDQALKRGVLAWQLSIPSEIEALLGPPLRRELKPDGGMVIHFLHYPHGFTLVMGGPSDGSTPPVLLAYGTSPHWVRPPEGTALKLGKAEQLCRLNPTKGLQGVDVSEADLKDAASRLDLLPFDSQTRWPSRDRLPAGFNPQQRLEEGKNPGLGIHALHEKGLDGRGIQIAVIDQPFGKAHREFASRLNPLGAVGVEGVPPQMHGPAVISLAAGETCGVAPGAQVHHVAVPMWNSGRTNSHYLAALRMVLEANRKGTANIRIVNISDGRFPAAQEARAWADLVSVAEAEGVWVVTCDPGTTGLDFGLLRPLPGGDPEKPTGYGPGSYNGRLWVPGDGRTYASHADGESFAHAPSGGKSWAAPWVAGLAALGLQVNPGMTPALLRKALRESAVPASFGDIVHPAAFLEACRNSPPSPPSRR